jgi:prophage regulatory protein
MRRRYFPGFSPSVAVAGIFIARSPHGWRKSVRLIRTKEVLGILGVSRSTLWRMVRAGRFPKPIMISTWASGYLDVDVQAWLEARQERPAASLHGSSETLPR